MMAGDTGFHTQQRKLMGTFFWATFLCALDSPSLLVVLRADFKISTGACLYRDKWQQQIKDFYEYITLRLLREKSCKIAGINQVDITREYVIKTRQGCRIC